MEPSRRRPLGTTRNRRDRPHHRPGVRCDQEGEWIVTDYLGLPVFKPLYGFGDVATLTAKTTVALVGGADGRAIAGALPSHPKIKPVHGAPLVVMQSDFTSAMD